MKDKEKILKSIKKRNLSANDLERILKSVENTAPKQVQSFEDYFENKTKIGVFSDCHIGAKEFDEPFFKHMVKIFKREKVKRVYQCGDILEGMSNRPGHIYELSEIGYHKQMEKATRLFKLITCPIYGIDGNHDEWFQKKCNQGVVVGVELDRAVKNYHHLGQMEANVKLRSNVNMKLFHPNDGTAYAMSYKMQKMMESFTGGEKPQILLQGHYHKSLYMFNRHIHGIECGTLSSQTRWMRGRKIQAHKGFWVINIQFGRGGIGKFEPAFYAGYK